ncbi:MAG TPA: glutaredoxin 3 [Desulfosalsimonadaceae bacterium]|nr:glutaredoxin 3 [Desulfosalsimonadaceae bacterium]
MPEIEIYTSSTCGYCKQAKKLLDSKNVSYDEKVVDANPQVIAEAVKRSDGRRTVPQIFINGQHVGGYDELAELDKTGKLDSLLSNN